MKNLKLIWLVLLTCLCADGIFAQKKDEKPNFSGTWELNPKKSEIFSAAPSLSVTYRSEMFARCKIKYLITHNEPELKITQTSICKEDGNSNNLKTTTVDYTYFTDKRGEINGYSDDKKIESITKWSGKKVVIKIFITDIKSNKKTDISTREISISKDGKRVDEIIYSEASSGSIESLFNSIRTKLVYDIVN